ncbi:hypothetical protein GCM10010441_62350 [Kitasatospora paracochleata]|uniref:Uncharacterized protein n=1 Tax=Kitasatospora paracochleata TaxID=58354 RepID=A0ABT1IZH6_9ACTN|nr:hypothetical protein [Kitasatospora paracochleata]MCP2310560.1 hypothetical protein [Kitasatospora paracochleata]
MAEPSTCAECATQPAVLEDLDTMPPAPWCLGCALVLVKLGDPVLNYRALGDIAEYTAAIARGTTATLRFG